jgi:hypothetical protein
MPFPILGKKSTDQLTELLRFVASGDPEVEERAVALRERTTLKWSWDGTASIVTRRLLEVQP